MMDKLETDVSHEQRRKEVLSNTDLHWKVWSAAELDSSDGPLAPAGVKAHLKNKNEALCFLEDELWCGSL